jgi:hypothetical protein
MSKDGFTDTENMGRKQTFSQSEIERMRAAIAYGVKRDFLERRFHVSMHRIAKAIKEAKK